MKTKKITAAMLLLLCLLSFSGCQLARGDAAENPESRQLIGVLLTTEYLDLFDFESFLEDNKEELSAEELKSGTNSSQYNGRLYAAIKGQDTAKEYIFESVEGISFYAVTVTGTDGEDCIISSSDEAVSNTHTALSYSDKEDKMTLEAAIYLTADFIGKTYYINPIYQSSNGDVYAMTGNGMMIDGSSIIGEAYSTTLDETTTVTENEKSKKSSISIRVSFNLVNTPQQITVLQMSQDNTVIARREYAPESVPENFIPEAEAEYIIVETLNLSSDHQSSVTREIFGRQDSSFSSLSHRDDGVCIKRDTSLLWK